MDSEAVDQCDRNKIVLANKKHSNQRRIAHISLSAGIALLIFVLLVILFGNETQQLALDRFQTLLSTQVVTLFGLTGCYMGLDYLSKRDKG